MGTWFRFLITFLCLLNIQPCLTYTANLTLSPSPLLLPPDSAISGGNVTVTCSAPPQVSISQIEYLSIQRSLLFGPEVELLFASNDSNNGEPVKPQTGVAIASYDGGVARGFIRLVMTGVSCEGISHFLCLVTYLNSSGAACNATDSSLLPVKVLPGQLTLTSSPLKHQSHVGDLLTLTCSGPVGTIIDASQAVTWRWEFKDATLKKDTAWHKIDSDDRYNITIGPNNPGVCAALKGSSTLTVRLTAADLRRDFRCYVDKEGVQYMQQAGFYFGSQREILIG